MQPRFSAPMFLALAALVSAQTTFASPRNILLARGRTEPVVAVDPRSPSTIVVGSNTNYDLPTSTLPTGYFTSHDGGKTFSPAGAPLVSPYVTGADPSIAIAQSGTVFYSYLGEAPAYCTVGRSAVLLTTSTDGGRSFRMPTVVNAGQADDKPGMAVESVPGRRAHVFISWTRWLDRTDQSQIWFARSLDGGDTFSRPVLLYASKASNFGSLPVVGPGGRVYLFWSRFPDAALTAVFPVRIFMRVSRDDGHHFGSARAVTGSFSSAPQMSGPGQLRNLTAPAVAIGSHGTVYLAWSQVTRTYGQGAVDSDIVVKQSTDGGNTWSRLYRVNDSRRGGRFMPSVSVLPDQSLGFVYYDQRRGPWSLDVYAAHASFAAGFHRTQNVRVNQRQSPVADVSYIKPGSTCFSPGRFFGDYIGSAATPSGDFCVVWADTQLQVYDETDLWFARFRLPGFEPKRG